MVLTRYFSGRSMSRRKTSFTTQLAVRFPDALLAEVREVGGLGRSTSGSVLMLVREGLVAVRTRSAVGGSAALIEDRVAPLVGEIEGVLRG